MACGQKSRNPAGPQTTSVSPGSHGARAAAIPSGRTAAILVDPSAVGIARSGSLNPPTIVNPSSARMPLTHSSAAGSAAATNR